MLGPSANGMPIATKAAIIGNDKLIRDRRRYAAQRQMAKLIGADECKAKAEAKRARKNAKRLEHGL